MSASSYTRCAWPGTDPLYLAYHDEDWGVPVHDDRLMFELLTLEGAQAGLSWLTILRRRSGYQAAYEGFEPATVAGYGEAETTRLLADTGVIRNRAKVAASITNAQRYLAVQAEFGSFCAYLWAFVGNTPIVNHWTGHDDVPATTPLAEAISKDLKRRGFKFVGPTIIYAHLQSAGLVNDHIVNCFRHPDNAAGACNTGAAPIL